MFVAKNVSIKAKIILLVFLLLIGTLVSLVGYEYHKTKQSILNNETTYYQLVDKTVATAIDNQTANARHAVLGLVNDQGLQQAFAERNREQLATLADPIFATLKSEGISQLQFHLPPAISFYRAHKPEQHSDDLSSFRHTVVTCNQNKTIVQGLEEGVAGFGFRVVVPVIHQGVHLGSVEVGSNFSNDFTKDLQKSIDGEFFIYQLQNSEPEGVLLGGTAEQDPLPTNDDIIKQVVQRGEMSFYATNDDKAAVLIIPITDYSGKVIGFIKGGLSRVHYVEHLNQLLLSGAISLMISLLVATILLVLALNIIFKPVDSLIKSTQVVASGDLTVDIEENSQDEVGKLAQAFRSMVVQMRQMTGEIMGKSQQVFSSTQTLNSISQQNAHNAHEHATFMNEIASGVENVNQNVNQIAITADRTTDFANQGQQAIVQLTNQMNKIMHATEGVSRAINGLNIKSTEINHIVELITNIASQTNLLALNATIEAARAGEHGKGFAVVAAQVRTLAEDSATAANNIYHLIKDVQSETQRAVISIDTSNTEVESGNQVVTAVEQLLNQIIAAVHSLTLEINSITTAMGGISVGVQNANAAVEEQTAAVEEANVSVESLSNICEDLNELVKRFKLQR